MIEIILALILSSQIAIGPVDDETPEPTPAPSWEVAPSQDAIHWIETTVISKLQLQTLLNGINSEIDLHENQIILLEQKKLDVEAALEALN